MDTRTQNPTGLTGRQRKLIEALLESPSITSAAERAGVCRSTAHAWMREPGFRAELDKAQRVALDAALSRISTMAGEASNRLAKLIASENEAVSLGACRLVLETGVAHGDARAISMQIEDLEARLAEARR